MLARNLDPVPANDSETQVGDRTESTQLERALREVGQCVVCAHARKLTNAKGSDFYRCGKAKDDPRLTDYPPLPVRGCHAFERSGDP